LRYCRPTIDAIKLTTDRHEASRGLFATAELLVFAIDHVLVSLINLIKTITTTGAIFSLQFTKNVWRTGSARTRWGSVQAPSDPLAAIGGLILRGEEGRQGKEREGKGRRGGEGRGREGRPYECGLAMGLTGHSESIIGYPPPRIACGVPER